jgi:hypothetical protein
MSWDNRARVLGFAARDGAYPEMKTTVAFNIVCGTTNAHAQSVIFTGRPLQVALSNCR